jgi:hypothetical protein
VTDTVFRLDPVRPERYSMSYLRAADGCLRRAHYDREEDTAGVDAIIGRIFHEGAAVTGFAVTIRGDTRPGPGEVERIFRRVLERPEEHEPLSRHVWTEVMDLAGKWRPVFREGERFEVSMRHEIRGRILSARIDRLFIDGNHAIVEDYKTGFGSPPQRSEPTPQGDNYAWHVFMEFPFVDEVTFAQEHVRFGFEPIPFTYTREHSFPAISAWLWDNVGRIDAAYEKGGELPTNPGDACDAWGGCPVAADCPVKQWARPGTVIRKHEDALEQFTALLVEEASVAARKKQIRGWVERAGVRAVQLDGQEIGYGTDAGESTDWKAIATAAAPDDETIAAHTRPRNPSFGRRKAK